MSPARREPGTCVCGKPIVKAAIVHDGKDYCRKCWRKYFQRVPCRECGKLTSSYMGQTPVTCKVCNAKGRICKNCGEEFPVKRVGRVFPDGSALCSKCIRKDKEPKVCPNCGGVTKYLGRDVKAGFLEPVCATCRSKARPTVVCEMCGKKRQRYDELNGKVVCFTCYESATPTMCPDCGKVQISSTRLACKDCEAKVRVRLEAQEVALTLKQDWLRKLFMQFVEEQISAYGGYDTGLRYKQYLKLFVLMDGKFKSVDDITSESFLILCKFNNALNYRLLFSFLLKRGLIVEHSIDEKSDALATARHEFALSKIKGKWYHPLIVDFRAELYAINGRYKENGWVGRKRRFSLASITDMIRTSMQFCEMSPVKASFQFEQHHIEEFLTQKPSMRDSLGSFVRFLRLKKKTFARLRMPKKIRKNLNIDNILSNERCEELICTWLNPIDSKVKESLICLLMLLYAQRSRRISLMQLDHIFQDKKGFYIVVGKKKKLKLHDAAGNLLNRWLELRSTMRMDDDSNDYLFPGAYKGSHLSDATITMYPKIYGVTCSQMYTSGVYRAVSGGVRMSSSLINMLGVSLKTAATFISFVDEQMDKDFDENIY